MGSCRVIAKDVKDKVPTAAMSDINRENALAPNTGGYRYNAIIKI